MELRKIIFIMYPLRICLGFFLSTLEKNHCCLFLQVANGAGVSQEPILGCKVRSSPRYLKFMWISNLLAGNDGKPPSRDCLSCSKRLSAHWALFFFLTEKAMLIQFEFANVRGKHVWDFHLS